MIRTAAALATTLAAVLAAPSSWAEAQTYSFDDPKGTNGVAFVMDSELEPLVGIVGGVQGEVSYDPADPTSLTGEVSVDMAEVKMINATMVDHLKGAQWLNIEDQFIATMRFDEVTSTKSGDDESDATMLTVEATLMFGQQELPMTLQLSVTQIPGGGKDRGGAESGDLLVLRSQLVLSRKELGIKPEMGTEKVGDEIAVMVPVVAAPR